MAESADQMHPIERSAMPRGVAGVETALFDGEAVLFRVETATVHRLGGVAGAVWLLCDGETTIAQMVDELVEAFGWPEAAMTAALDEALAHLAQERLLVDDAPVVRTELRLAEHRASDGSVVVSPPMSFDPDPDLEPSTTGVLALRLGAERDLLVVVAADPPAVLERIDVLTAAWVDRRIDVSDLPVALTLRDMAVVDAAGPRPLPHLTFGDLPLARTRQPDDVLRALGSVLGGIHHQRSKSTELWVGLRPFARGDRVVLVDAARPLVLNDPVLAEAGIDELPTWAVWVQPDHPDGAVVVPPPLASLDWSGAGLAPPVDLWRRFALDGIVTLGSDTVAGAVSVLAAQSHDPAWFATVAALADEGRVLVAEDVAAARVRVRLLLDA